MKNIILFILLAGILSACKGQATNEAAEKSTTEASTKISQRLDNAAFQAKLNDPDVVILDVRTPAETDRGVIEGATLIDYKSPNFKARIEALDKEKTYLVYCQGGGRSARACQMMQGMGFTTLYELETGYGGL